MMIGSFFNDFIILRSLIIFYIFCLWIIFFLNDLDLSMKSFLTICNFDLDYLILLILIVKDWFR